MTRGPRDRFPTEETTDVRGSGGSRADTEVDMCTLLPPLDDRPGPARRLVSARSTAMVRAIMDAAQAPLLPELAELANLPAPPIGRLPEGTRPALQVVQIEAPPRRRRSSHARVVALLAAAMVVTVVGGAAAAVWVARAAPPQPLPVPAILVTADRPAPKPAKTDDDEVVIIEEDVSLDEELEKELAAEELDMPAEVVSSRRRRPSADRELPANAPPKDVLALANQRRKEKRWRDADALYRRVMVRNKGTDEAVVAMVVSAELHLDHLDDAAGALRRFRRALRLRPRGPLAEEARWGVAESLRALGDADAEAEALRAFMSSHPESANAPAARRRLGEIAPL